MKRSRLSKNGSKPRAVRMSRNIDLAVANAKKRLVAKAKKSGLWENFGQDEANKIHLKFADVVDPYGSGAERENYDKINEFRNWAMDFDQHDLERA